MGEKMGWRDGITDGAKQERLARPAASERARVESKTSKQDSEMLGAKSKLVVEDGFDEERRTSLSAGRRKRRATLRETISDGGNPR
jgi:hypothetical protein